jgi:hypothetical protein
MRPRTIALGVGLMLLVAAGPASASPGSGAHQFQEPVAHCDDGSTRVLDELADEDDPWGRHGCHPEEEPR